VARLFPTATLSAVIVIESALPEAFFVQLSEQANSAFAGFELVIVANGVTSTIVEQVQSLITRIPDATAHLLLERVDSDAARLFGMDNALSDWVLLIDPTMDQLKYLPDMLQVALTGHDAVVVDSGRRPSLTCYDLLADRYIQFARYITGLALERGFAPLRLLNRALCLRIVNDPYGELLIRASAISGGFRLARIDGDYSFPMTPQRRQIRRGLRQGIGTLVRSSALPLRAVSAGALSIGLLSLLYTAYVVAIYLFKRDVAPGWTTISLQLATLMILVSLMFWMIAEYIIVIRSALPPRRRIVVGRELRSAHSTAGGLLNVVDAEGRNLRLGSNVADY
jgi:polyisoprenyl-phosphate glycosyltransferase